MTGDMTAPSPAEFDADPDGSRERLHQLKNDILRAGASLEILIDQLRGEVETYQREHPSP